MLDLDPSGEGTTPRDAATLIVVRDTCRGAVEVFCVERHRGGFLGGAVVFPGGRLEPDDLDSAWSACATPFPSPRTTMAPDDATMRGLAIAACREALEEAAILPVTGPAFSHADLLALRARGDLPRAIRDTLAARGQKLDLGSLRPLARWITPAAEPRRFDTRFFLFVADGQLTGAHDDQETTASFWATPEEVLGRFDAGQLVLAPPTHRTFEVLRSARTTGEAVAIADAACLEPICPQLVGQPDAGGETIALVLPGDPAHPVPAARVGGASRFVLRDGRFRPEEPPR